MPRPPSSCRDESGEADFELRWFTPTSEVRLCGHATLASGHVALTRDGGERVTFRTRHAGILEVRRAEGGYELALPTSTVAERAVPGLLAALGCEGRVFDTVQGTEETTIVLMENEAAVRALSARHARIGKDRPDGDLHRAGRIVRRRQPSVSCLPGGVPEDSVTGSAHSVLAPFWAERLGRDHFTAHQASARGGNLTVRLDGERAWLGGPCVTVVEGTFYLPD